MFVRIKKMPMKILAQNKKKLSVSIKIIKDTFQGFIDDNVMRFFFIFYNLRSFLYNKNRGC